MWTQKNDDYLKKYHKEYGDEQLAKHLHCTDRDILDRKFELGLCSSNQWWTKSEAAFLSENYKELTSVEIGAVLDKTPDSVRRKAYKLNLVKNREDRALTQEEKYLVNNTKKSISTLAKELNVPQRTIKRYKE